MYPKRRQNLVAILINSRNQNGENGTLVGFKSLYFMDEGRIVLESAFRIASELRGQGVGKVFSEWRKKYLTQNYPKTVIHAKR